MKKYSVSAFNHSNEYLLQDEVFFANDFKEANQKVEKYLQDKGVSTYYTTVSIKEIT